MSAITELALNNGETLHSQAGALLLADMVRKSVLNTAISVALTPWRKLRAVHDPGKILLDVALAVALGGGCLADIGMLFPDPPRARERASRIAAWAFGPDAASLPMTRETVGSEATGPNIQLCPRWPVRTVRPPTAR